jgi:hypothetical protein
MKEKKVLSLALGLLVVAFFYSNIPSENLAGSAVYGYGEASREQYVLMDQAGCNLEFKFVSNKGYPANPGERTIRDNNVKIGDDIFSLYGFNPRPWSFSRREYSFDGDVVTVMKPFGGASKISHPIDPRKHVGKMAVLTMNVVDYKSPNGLKTIKRSMMIEPCV